MLGVDFSDIHLLQKQLEVATLALSKITKNIWKASDPTFCHPEGCDSPETAQKALDEIKRLREEYDTAN